MDNKHLWVAVMAGGEGTRLFPISYPGRPKQFCQLDDKNTFIQATISNFVSLGVKTNQVVAITTNKCQTELAKEQVLPRGLLSQNICQINPNWGYPGAMYQATKFIAEIDPEAIVICTPSDHYLKATDDDFAYTVKTAVAEAENGYPVLIGVKVHDLVTATGCGHAIFEDTGDGCYEVVDFVEKPNEKLADKIMRRDDSACNTGIVVWQASTLLDSIDEQEVWGIGTDEFLNKFETLKIAVGDFAWVDCGNYESLFGVLPKTPHHKNACIGEGTFERVRCRGSLLHALEGTELYVCGAKDTAVIFTTIDDRPILVVADLERSQGIKELAEDYYRNEKLLKKDFSLFGARNNIVLGSNISDELIVAFVGVSNYAVYVRKRANGILEAAVSHQLPNN